MIAVLIARFWAWLASGLLGALSVLTSGWRGRPRFMEPSRGLGKGETNLTTCEIHQK